MLISIPTCSISFRSSTGLDVAVSGCISTVECMIYSTTIQDSNWSQRTPHVINRNIPVWSDRPCTNLPGLCFFTDVLGKVAGFIRPNCCDQRWSHSHCSASWSGSVFCGSTISLLYSLSNHWVLRVIVSYSLPRTVATNFDASLNNVTNNRRLLHRFNTHWAGNRSPTWTRCLHTFYEPRGRERGSRKTTGFNNYVPDIFKMIIQEDNTKSDAVNVKTWSQDGCQPDPTLKPKGRIQHISATLPRA